MRRVGRAWRTGLVALALATWLGGCGDGATGGGDADAVEDVEQDTKGEEVDAGDDTQDAGDDAQDAGDDAQDAGDDAGPDADPDTEGDAQDASPDVVDVDDATDVDDVDDAGPDGDDDAEVVDAGDDVDAGQDAEADVAVDVEPPPECEADADCAGTPGTGPCRPAVCLEGVCAAGEALADGSECDDGNACSLGDTCKAGKCGGTSALTCNDDNPCTDDSCQPAKGCVYKNNFAACDDGDACTVGDACLGGACISGPQACDDGNPCTTDQCDPQTGACTNLADDALPCSDGSACTLGDACVAGACVPGAANGCDDGNPCTGDSCVGGTTCQNADLNNVPCDDGEPCTATDLCKAGVCAGGPATVCDDGNPCTADECVDGQGCQHTVLVGAACDDGDACTEGDQCAADGQCVAGQAIACDDANPCTQDACDPAVGCVFTPAEAVCDDGSACTEADACVDGECVGEALDCDDANACTLDTCDPLVGCEHLPTPGVPCEDGDACTEGDLCSAQGQCVSGEAVACEDDNACTEDACDPAAGCTFTPLDVACDDGSACTEGDTCVAGECVGAALDCDDDDVCTQAACDPETGCEHLSLVDDCDDGVGCTVDTCDPVTGCSSAVSDAACGEGERCDPELDCVDATALVMVSRVLLLPADGGDEGVGQWIELVNVGTTAVELGTLVLTNAAGVQAMVHPLGDDPLAPIVLEPGERLAGFDAAGADSVDPADFGFTYGVADDAFWLDPAGDLLLVGLPDEAPMDLLPLEPTVGDALEPGALPMAVGYPTALDAAALALGWPTANDSGDAWCVLLPQLEAQVAAEAPDCARAVLNEVALAGPDGARWIEVHLPAGGWADGLRVRVLDADGASLGEHKLDGRVSPGDAKALVDGELGADLPTLTDGAVQLWRDGALLDVVGFGTLNASVDGQDGQPLFEGAALPALTPEAGLARVVDGVDTDDNEADWQSTADGTPGTLAD